MRYHLDTDFLVYLTRNTRDFAGIPGLRTETAGRA